MREYARCLGFLAALLLAPSAQAAAPSCTLSAPVTAMAGTFFSVGWSYSNGVSAEISRDDGTIVAQTSAASGTAGVWATSVLDPHTYTMTVMNAKGRKGRCTAVVGFTYAPVTVAGYDIIVVAGQSNAVGKGLGAFDALDQNLLANDVVQIGRLRDSNMQVVPVGYWQDGTLFDGLQFWDRTEGDTEMGFALSFAEGYIKKGELAAGRKLLVVPAAEGGSSILDWLDPGSGALYGDMLDRVNTAMNLPGDNRVVAFLWQQGENDVLKIEDGEADMSVAIYKADLTQLFSNVRRDLAAPAPFPILAGLMVPHWLSGDPTGLAIKKSIEGDIRQVTKADTLGNFVKSSGLTSNAQIGFPKGGDEHFDAQSQTTLGGRYFKGWVGLERGN